MSNIGRLEDPLAALSRVVRRLIVLPFRMLRPDAEIDFLAFSLPDAIANSLFGLDSLVVRSSMTASKYAGPSPDLKVIAAEAEVDVVLTGTLLRSGDQLRVSAQLAEAPAGTMIWSQTSQMDLKEIFQLQDEIVQRVVKSLELPLTGRESRLLKHDVPSSPTAYECYLRANELSTDWGQTLTARDLYLSCVSLDPQYAPAWARLGRCYRVISKYGGDAADFSRAEEAFRRALELNPDLTLAHNFFASLEADLGRAESAMARLLECSRTNRSDPNLFSGLVYACRFCGLLDASIAAHQQARRLDPQIPTSVNQSYFMSGDYRQALETSGGDFGYMNALALASLGRENEAVDLLRRHEQRPAQHALVRSFLTSLRALLEGKREEGVRVTEQVIAAIHKGGEELFYCARQLAYLGELDRALFELERSVDRGFFCHAVMMRDPWLDSLRNASRFRNILDKARSRHEAARRMFIEAGGMRILGAA
jgi:TolB-like protein